MAVVEKDDPDKVKSFVGVNGVARRVQKIYIGVNGVARKVKKVYIGVNGVAKLCWSGETVYTWEQWSVNTSQNISTNSYTDIVTRTTSNGDLTPITTSVRCYSSVALSNGTIIGTGGTSYQPINNTGNRYFSYNGNWYYKSSGDADYLGDREFYFVRAFKVYISTTTSKGSNYIGTVESTNPSAYPTNGAKNGYWYVKK